MAWQKWWHSKWENVRGGRGVTSQPILRRKPWSSLEIPPITATVRMPSGLPNFMVSSSICCANSRVGAKMTAYGPWSESSILLETTDTRVSEGRPRGNVDWQTDVLAWWCIERLNYLYVCLSHRIQCRGGSLDFHRVTCQSWAGWWSTRAEGSRRQLFYRCPSLPRQWCHGSAGQSGWPAAGWASAPGNCIEQTQMRQRRWLGAKRTEWFFFSFVKATNGHWRRGADLVTAFVNNLQNVCWQRILLPVSDGVGNLATLCGDAVVLSEDSPVSVGHLIQLLLRPVSVVPALLGLLLAHLLQSCPKSEMDSRWF